MKQLILALIHDDIKDLRKYNTIRIVNKNDQIIINTKEFYDKYFCTCGKLLDVECICMHYIWLNYRPGKRQTKRRKLKKELIEHLAAKNMRLQDNVWNNIIKRLNSGSTQYRLLKIQRL